MENQTIISDERWEQIANREVINGDPFRFGVVTTGVYCRVGCSSRQPNRENVRPFASWQQAEAAGFRACKRCAPRQQQAPEPYKEAVLAACRTLDQAETAPTLAELAEAAGFSPFHFQRFFKEALGVSPQQYYQQKRQQRLRAELQEASSVTAAQYEAGFGSSSRLYAAAPRELGMQPGRYREGGAGLDIRYAVAPSALGYVLAAASQEGLCALHLGAHPQALIAALQAEFPRATLITHDPEFEDWVQIIVAFVEDPGRGLDLPLDIRGTAFQRQVWQALREIPAGQTASYSEVARRIGQPRAARAVAQACAANKLAVAVPCHRVVRQDGGLGGYRWGVDRKRELLARERENSGTAHSRLEAYE
jgi:AraC family transcriptional regulator of adaptative response/methylated-DNA-[protein]-cysteine methyltransferase